jgi:lipopolysaccharide transport system ATP-binding protein
MSNTAILLKDVSKKYRLFNSTQDRLKEALHPFSKQYHREFWALDRVSLEIPWGKTIGILGRNGSGKSTLLQIIAGIMPPTSGEVIVNGRISALLELGAGFNPEFTGRENAIFQAQVMGQSNKKIEQTLLEIKSFADIGEFFDQPVKLYSSGMFLRLAFAAAINVDPDILIVDEALAVGDAKFQHKCFERIAAFQKMGKTIIFVSHNTSLITNHCDRAILLENGGLITDGKPDDVVNEYRTLLFGHSVNHSAKCVDPKVHDPITVSGEHSNDLQKQFLSENKNAVGCQFRSGYNPGERTSGDGSAEIIDYLIGTFSDIDCNTMGLAETVRLLIKVKFVRPIKRPLVGFEVKTVDGVLAYGSNTYMMGVDVREGLAGEVRVFQFSFHPRLSPGDYFITLGIGEVDGTPGGSSPNVRLSVVHMVLVEERVTFNGMADLSPTFLDVFETGFGSSHKTAFGSEEIF